MVFFFNLFVFRSAIALARAYREIAALDAHRYRSEAAVALIVGRIVGQRVLVSQFVRDEGEGEGGAFNALGAEI